VKKNKEKKFFRKIHTSTKRNYLERMMNKKIYSMKIAKKYGKDYWDGNRSYGYGGYKFIKGYWTNMANKLIKHYKLSQNSKILDIGCGKGYLLYEIKKIIPSIKIVGIDISKYAIKNSKKEIKKYLFVKKAQVKLKYKKDYFDLVISMGCLHNLFLYDLKKAITTINHIAKKSYIMVESYRSNKELFNLQCWALTCNSFFSKKEWLSIFKENNYIGDYEFIYFN
jgi:ubiquinone/menaquinone biosynthesis C-methylase UbiE